MVAGVANVLGDGLYSEVGGLAVKSNGCLDGEAGAVEWYDSHPAESRKGLR